MLNTMPKLALHGERSLRPDSNWRVLRDRNADFSSVVCVCGWGWVSIKESEINMFKRGCYQQIVIEIYKQFQTEFVPFEQIDLLSVGWGERSPS